jgi:hypothetical protein
MEKNVAIEEVLELCIYYVNFKSKKIVKIKLHKPRAIKSHQSRWTQEFFFFKKLKESTFF